MAVMAPRRSGVARLCAFPADAIVRAASAQPAGAARLREGGGRRERQSGGASQNLTDEGPTGSRHDDHLS